MFCFQSHFKYCYKVDCLKHHFCDAALMKSSICDQIPIVSQKNYKNIYYVSQIHRNSKIVMTANVKHAQQGGS